MRKLKIYLETTVFNYYFDDERDEHPATVKLFDEIMQGKFGAFTSTLVIKELSATKNDVRREKLLSLIGKYNIQVVEHDNVDINILANHYVKENIIPASYRNDAVHIAVSTFYELDCIISMNFTHINKYKTKVLVARNNAILGYIKTLDICSSWEVVE